MKDINDEKTEMEDLEAEVAAFFDRGKDYPQLQKEYSREKNVPGWSRRSLLLVGLLCVVLGVLLLTVVFFMRPDVQRPQIVADRIRLPIVSIEREGKPTVPGEVGKKEADEKPLKSSTPREGKISAAKPPIMIAKRGLDEKVVIIAGIKEDEKTPAEARRHKVEQQIAARDMETTEKIPDKIPVQEKSSAGEIKEKSLEETPQYRPMSSDKAELDRKRGPMEAIARGPSEPKKEQSVSLGAYKETVEEKEREKEEKITRKDVKGDQRVPSSVETSLPTVKPQTAITAQRSVRQPKQLSRTKDTQALRQYDEKNDLRGKGISVARLPAGPKSSSELEERIVRPRAPALVATEEEVRQFFADYVEKYEQKDIDGFLSLFSPKAIQNRRDGFEGIKRIYSDFFEKSRELRYHMEGIRIEIYQNMAEVRGRYQLAQISKKRGKRQVWRGNVRWVLSRENGALKIRYLDYRHQK